LLIANESTLLEKLLRKPAKPKEVEALLDELEAGLGVEITKEDAVRSLCLGAGQHERLADCPQQEGTEEPRVLVLVS